MAPLKDTPTMDDFRKALRNHGLKATDQRLAIHAAMMDLGHASADMVREHILSRGGAVTLASVYNTLTQLALLGIYKHRLSANNKMYFDVNTTGHMHLYDTINHVYIDIYDDLLYKSIADKLLSKRFKGYKVDGMDIQILAHPTSRRRK